VAYISGDDVPYNLRVFAVGDSLKSIPLIDIPARRPVISPNGRYIAYSSSESGRREVYVKPFPQGEGRWHVSSGGGIRPRWNKDGTELFYSNKDTLMAVSVDMRRAFSSGIPKKLFKLPSTFGYDIASDGQRFLVVRQSDQVETPKITIVENWVKEFPSRE
jgi:serine/threonine-protein kinase